MKTVRARVPSYILMIWSMLALAGCLSLGREVKIQPVVSMPQRPPSIVKLYKTVTVPANQAGMVETGVDLAMGEPFTLLVTGVVDLYPRIGSRKMPEDGVLFARVGKGVVVRALSPGSSARTDDAPGSGELCLGISDPPYSGIHADGTPRFPRYYQDNTGSFIVDVLVWSKKDYVQIAEFLDTLRRRDPANKSLQHALKEIAPLKEFQLASEGAPGDPRQRARLEAMKSKLEEERKKSTALARELEEKEKKERDLMSRLQEGAKGLPVIVIATPQDGSRVETNTVRVSGAAEAYKGISRIEIFVGDRHLKPEGDRGLLVKEAEPPERVEFNELILLEPGSNEIKVRAVDREGLASEKTVSVHRTELQKNIWAVAIGVNSYPKVPQLKFAVDDARAFRDYLVDRTGIPPGNVTLLLDEEATLGRLRSVLGTHLKNKAGKEDMVVIYFAGHGATERDVMSPDGDGLEKYLLPFDADPKDLYASALPMREIAHIFQRIRSERLIFLVDACYSGASGGRTIGTPGLRANLTDAFLDRVAGGRGTIILTASAANEVSQEKEEYGHGVFTHFLLKGLEGEADVDGDGLITVDEAYGYVSKHVPQATGQEQHPVRKGQVEGSLILGITR
ncbi:MAG: caspase family protein [Thermodesulfobacteriota bacterium]